MARLIEFKKRLLIYLCLPSVVYVPEGWRKLDQSLNSTKLYSIYAFIIMNIQNAAKNKRTLTRSNVQISNYHVFLFFLIFPYFAKTEYCFVTYSMYFIIWLLLLSRLRYDFSYEWHLHGASQGFINSCVVRICTRGTVFVCFKRYFVDLQVFSLLLKVCFYYIWH